MTDLKVGDEVEVIHESASALGLGTSANNMNYKKGFSGTITAINEECQNYGFPWITLNNAKNDIGAGLLKKIEKQEFKVGQRVLVHSGANIEGYDNKEGIITKVCSNRNGYPHLEIQFNHNYNKIQVYEEKNTKFNVEIIDNNKTKTNMQLTKENAKVGMKVKRGENWEWNNQDIVNGKPAIGIILNSKEYFPAKPDYEWVEVQWEWGNIKQYRIGYEGKFDLIIAEEQKTYPEKFYVEGGSKSIREAFIKDLQQAKLSPSGTFTESMFIKDSNNLSLQGNKYWSTTTMPGHKYTLPADYNEALEAFKELLKEPAKPQCINVKVNYKDGQLNINIKKGRIETIDGIFIDEIAEKYIANLQNIISSSEKIVSSSLGKWNIKIEKITVGCKIDCNILDLKEILIKWKELN